MADDTISRKAAIDADGLDEEIRCEMCKNPMHTDRGCDGNCKYDEILYEKIIQILNKRITPLTSAQPDVPDTNVGDTISRQAVIELIQGSICDLEYSDENRELCNKVRALPPSPSRPIVTDTDIVSRQAAIDALMEFDKKLRKINWYQYPYTEHECRGVDEAIVKIANLPSAQPEGWLKQNKDKILQAGMEGREIDFRIGGRLFAIREKAQ